MPNTSNLVTDDKTNITFDDVVENEVGCKYTYWTQLCETHSKDANDELEEISGDGYICGVNGCEEEATYYYDFNGK